MTKKYIGEKCMICGSVFEEDQEIVVCPDCGTPYHKTCWFTENKCINTELHNNGGEWQPQSEMQNALPQTGESVKCVRCGKENPPGQRFCGECGMPLNVNRDEPRPFNSPEERSKDEFSNSMNGGSNNFTNYQSPQDPFGYGMPVQSIKLTAQSDMDGIKLGDFFDYIGTRSLSVIANFVKFAKTGAKTSFNIAALLFPEFYFFYRRMIKQGVLFLLASFLLNIPTLILYGQTGLLGQVYFTTSINLESNSFTALVNMCQMLSWVLSLVAALFGNYWYYTKARRDIVEIRSVDGEVESDEVIKERIRSKGGTSWSAVVAAFAGEMILTLGFFLVMASFFAP